MTNKHSAVSQSAEMGAARHTLSDDSQLILQMIADGSRQSDILKQGLSQQQIMAAARHALALNAALHQHNQRVCRLQRQYPRAYDQWCADEERRVVALYKMGKTLREIAAIVKRKPTAVKDKLLKLGAYLPS
jgi:DNA-binding NarL/FixJ family response regulator